MDPKRLLIIGAYGQLGKALQARFPDATAVDRDQLDITDAHALSAFDWEGIDTILNAAAYTNVDGAESAEGRVVAWAINASAVANLARVAVARDLTLVHISSDYVFDGTSELHAETEPFSPLSVYGATKAAGDLAVSTVPKHYVLRVTWLIGDGPNFVRTLKGFAAKDFAPNVVHDQIGRLTFTSTLVDGIEHLLKTGAASGTYNLTNGGDQAAWSDIAQAIFHELGRDDLEVKPVTTAEYFADKPRAAKRPLGSRMDTAKLEATGFKPADWRTALHDYVQAELTEGTK